MKSYYAILRRGLLAITKPKSVPEDARRREFILNVLLLGALALALTALVKVTTELMIHGDEFGGAPPAVVLVVILCLSGLYGASRWGHPRVAAWLFIAIFTAIGAVTSYVWGIGLPAGPLVLVLVIVMTGVLAGTRASLLMMGVVSFIMLMLAYLESRGLSHPDLSWMQQTAGLGDAFGYIFIWGVIVLVSWLSNREIEHSLQRVRRSEADLEKQRDLLEVRVEERTRELKQAQLEKMLQLNRFADFGRISSGFFHDIINPLTAVSLNLEQLSTKRRSELLQQAIAGIKHIENFAVAARKQVQGHNDLRVFSPAREVSEVVGILENKARGARVSIACRLDDSINLYGSPVKFHQLVSNLVANAIDAYEEATAKSRVVVVSAARQGKHLKLTVSDSGVGIREDHLNLIFDPFFTTKPVDKGTGIGLLIVKRIVEEDFFGSITVESKMEAGTVFTIVLPAVSE